MHSLWLHNLITQYKQNSSDNLQKTTIAHMLYILKNTLTELRPYLEHKWCSSISAKKMKDNGATMSIRKSTFRLDQIIPNHNHDIIYGKILTK